MSFPEYRQQPEDHRSCIIMVQPIGSFVSKDSFSKIWAQLAKLEKVSIGKDGRSLYIRFVLNYPTENNEWGDFQHHRKVLGLICVARHNEKVSGSDLDKQYLDLKNLYDSTLLDSRLVILGLPRNAVRTKNDGMEFDESMATSCVTEGDLVIDPNHYDKEQPSKVIPDLLDRCNDGLKQIVSEMSDTTRRRILSYSDTEEACSYLNLDIEYMCQSLFYVLESKRLTATNVHVKQPSIITAPFETPSQLNMDLETKSVRNRFVARCRKRIGDLCLLVDLPNDAVVQYQAALELLNAAGDEFWVAGALEGLAVASSLVLSPYARHVTTDDNNMKRTSSFNGRTSPGLLLDPSITLHNSFNHLDLASSRPKVNVTFDDIIAKYREAISFYSKFAPAAIIEMEASLKATRLLIAHKKTKMASEFLHHVAYVSLDDISYKERVERYDVMGDLYQQLKFDRKAAFFKRVAAMHCVSPLLPSPAWADCYSLLLKAFPGFKMSFDPADYQTEGQTTGWPGIRLRVFHELIYAARQIGNSAIIVRHISLCLHTMFNYMTCNEIQDLIQLLETCTKDNRDDGLPLSTTHGVKLPPVPFSSFPLLRRFDVLKLTPQLEPHKLKEVLPTSSVFIYSPLNLSRQVTRSLSIAEYEFGWVQDNPGSVEVAVHNPLPVELRLTDLSLLVEGVQFQSFPSSHSLPADSGPHTINIMGIPRSHGTLRITGYQMTLFGVVSRCLFSQLTHIRQKVFTVDVAPCLPSLHVSSQLPKSPYIATGGDNLVVTSAILQVYAGERRECHVTLKNNGPDAITKIDVVLQSDKFQDILREVLELDHSSLTASLPIQPEAEAKLTIKTVGSLRLSDLPDEMLMSPADRESKHRASSALIESVLKITYTGHEGDKQLYYRESLMAIDTVLIPSINVISQRITSLDVGRCDVGFEVFNESNMALEIKSGQESVSLKPMQSDWIHCRVDKSHCCSTLEECKETLTDVSLTWICASNRSGHVSTSSLHWSEPELDKLRQRPFTVVGSVAKNSCSRYMVGETVQVTYAITNISESDFSDVELKVRLHQDIASSQSDVQMGTSYVCMGPVSHHIPQFESGAIVELKPVLCIFYSGQYTLECVCLHNGVPITHIDSGLSLVVT